MFLFAIQLHVSRKAKYIKQYTINKSVIVCLEINYRNENFIDPNCPFLHDIPVNNLLDLSENTFSSC